MAGKPVKVVVRERSEIVKRRVIDPLGQPGVQIPLKEPSRWVLRVANSSAHPGRIAEMIGQKGWTFVKDEDIDGTIEDYGYERRDGRIVRGHRGEEVLMKQERDDFREIQKAKTVLNIKNTFTEKAVKAAILERASQEEDGDRGATFLERSLRNVEITDSLQTIPEAER